MKITKKESVFQLAFLPRLFPVNVYFVEEEDGLTLIDAGLPFSANGILKAAARIGKPIVRIALTHAHGDHIGALDSLRAALPEAKVHVSARDARLLRGDRSTDPGEPAEPVRGDVPAPGKIKTSPDVLLADGDRVGSLLVVASPGHTPGSVSFFDPRSGALIAGDTFQTRGGVAVSGKKQPLFPFPAMATWSARTALASARRLRDLQPTLLAVGHGRMLTVPAAAMDRAIAEAERSLNASSGGAGIVSPHRT